MIPTIYLHLGSTGQSDDDNDDDEDADDDDDDDDMQEDAAGALAAWGPTHPNCSSQSLTSPSLPSSSSSICLEPSSSYLPVANMLQETSEQKPHWHPCWF